MGTCFAHAETSDCIHVPSATPSTASVHTLHMSKLVGTFVSRCYAIICNGAYCTRVQTCASVRFPNAWILWSYCVCRQHWRLASHIANLSKYRWVRRILAWNLSVRYRSLGRRPHTWDYQIQVFCRYKGLGPCLEKAKCHYHWTALFQVSYTFCYKTNVHNPVFFSPPVPKTGSPCGVQALTIGRYLSKLVITCMFQALRIGCFGTDPPHDTHVQAIQLLFFCVLVWTCVDHVLWHTMA